MRGAIITEFRRLGATKREAEYLALNAPPPRDGRATLAKLLESLI
jgi:hypothetical protein